MRLTCPNCQSVFELDDALIAEKGQSVKCSVCANIWFVSPQSTLELGAPLNTARIGAAPTILPGKTIRIAPIIDDVADDKDRLGNNKDDDRDLASAFGANSAEDPIPMSPKELRQKRVAEREEATVQSELPQEAAAEFEANEHKAATPPPEKRGQPVEPSLEQADAQPKDAVADQDEDPNREITPERTIVSNAVHKLAAQFHHKTHANDTQAATETASPSEKPIEKPAATATNTPAAPKRVQQGQKQASASMDDADFENAGEELRVEKGMFSAEPSKEGKKDQIALIQPASEFAQNPPRKRTLSWLKTSLFLAMTATIVLIAAFYLSPFIIRVAPFTEPYLNALNAWARPAIDAVQGWLSSAP